MATSFPTSLDTFSTKVDNVTQVIAADINNPQDAIEAMQVKVGVDSSAVATTIDYLLKNASSSNPGHVHTASAITDLGTMATETATDYLDDATYDPTAIGGDVFARANHTGTQLGTTILLKTYAGGGGASIGTMTLDAMQTGVHSKGIALHNGDGLVTENTSTSLDVSAGSTLIRPSDDKTASLEYLEWAAVTNQDITTLLAVGDVYVYVDYTNGSTIQFSNTNPDPTDEKQNIVLLGEAHPNSAGTAIYTIHDLREFVGNHPQEFSILHRNVFGVLVTGMTSSETGTRNLAIAAGTFHQHGYQNFVEAAFDTAVTGSFIYWYTDGVGGWNQVASSTQLSNTQYDNAGTLTSIPTNKWKKDFVFRDQTGNVHVLYGQASYNSEALAIDAPLPTLPDELSQSNHAYILSTWHIQEGTSSGTFTDVANRFNGSGALIVNDHGALIGLGDDDHVQYLLTDGSRDLTGSQNYAVSVNVASATTADIGAAASNYVHITGTTTITGLGTIASGAMRYLVFDGVLTFTHNGTSLILPTGANITTAAGDSCIAVSEGSGNWRIVGYQRADGKALAESVSLTGVETLTNKRIDARTNTIASSATPTPAGDTTDVFTVTAQAAAAAFAAPTGTPVNGQVLLIRIKDDGTARALTWNAIYRASTDLALPTTTILSKTLYLQFVYNSTDSKWDLLGLLNNFT